MSGPLSIRIGINGFGRMGRLALRAAMDRAAGPGTGSGTGTGEQFVIDEQTLAYSQYKTITEGDWSDCDLVFEATGKHHKHPDWPASSAMKNAHWSRSIT
jgi:glyceraldehyde 3-phosphate dehydrogenase